MKSGFLFAFLGAGMVVYSEFLATGFAKDYLAMLVFAAMVVPFIAVSLCFNPMNQQVATFREMLRPATLITCFLILCMQAIHVLLALQPTWSSVAAAAVIESCVLVGRVLGTLMFVVGLSIFLAVEDWRDLRPILA